MALGLGATVLSTVVQGSDCLVFYAFLCHLNAEKNARKGWIRMNFGTTASYALERHKFVAHCPYGSSDFML